MLENQIKMWWIRRVRKKIKKNGTFTKIVQFKFGCNALQNKSKQGYINMVY